MLAISPALVLPIQLGMCGSVWRSLFLPLYEIHEYRIQRPAEVTEAVVTSFTAEESARQVGRAREILKPKSVQLYLVFNSAATGISIGHSFCFLDTLAMRLGGESVF